jgi:hypothetical protein
MALKEVDHARSKAHLAILPLDVTGPRHPQLIAARHRNGSDRCCRSASPSGARLDA